jgi:hypothetical protein
MRPWSPARRGRDPRTKRTQTRSPQPARQSGQPGPPRPARTVASRRAGSIMWAVAWAVACGEHRRRRQQWNQRDSLPPPRPAHEEVTVNSIRRLRRPLARRASSPGRAEPQARQPNGQEPHLARRFIQHAAADASVAAGQTRPAPATATSRRRTITMAPAAAARPPAVHPLPARPGRVLGQPHQRTDGAPPMVPVLLPATGPALRSRDPVRW